MVSFRLSCSAVRDGEPLDGTGFRGCSGRAEEMQEIIRCAFSVTGGWMGSGGIYRGARTLVMRRDVPSVASG